MDPTKMSTFVCGTPFVSNPTPPTKEAVFRAELSKLSSREESRRIDQKLRETQASLSSRDERLLALRPVFDRLTLEFLHEVHPPKERCNPWLRSIITTLVIISIIFPVVYGLASTGNTGMAGIMAVLGLGVLCFSICNLLVQPVANSQEGQPEPFWITGGAIALSNLSIHPPQNAKWWWQGRTTFVFVQHLSVRFSIDACTQKLVWENALFSADTPNRLTGQKASMILARLFATTPAYRQLVNSFNALAELENELTFLQNLKTEVDRETAEAANKAQPQTPLTPAPESRQARSAQADHHNTKVSDKAASWETLIIPRSLRENLQAYVRILRDYEAYRAAGVHLPKGLLLFGPPGCGKTQIAKTLSAEGGLNFVALSTADCKAMWIGWSADRLAKVFIEARAKQPSLLFIDELDAVCPPCGMYHDSMSQEFTAQLLQEIDGIGSDGQAIFLVGATNRPDHVDSAMLSRFAERIEIPLPDEAARRALLEVFLGTMRFAGDRHHIIDSLAKATEGKSGRDLRALVNQAVLSAVKRTSSPKDFALCEADFERTSPATITTTERIPHLQVDPRIRETSFQLDPQVCQDAIRALQTLGFGKREAQGRVNAIKTEGVSTEDIIKAALRGGHCLSK
jgi:SpoVK/Ycf46/Vps4 family AAA+-type ATPase